MSAISVGKIVTKTMGREAGKKAVVTKIIDQNFVEITGPFDFTGVKRRRVNISHIEPSEFNLDIKKSDVNDEKIQSSINGNNEIKKFMETKTY